MRLIADYSRAAAAEELVVATGWPEVGFLREPRIRLDPALECKPALAPLIDPNEHSYGTVRPHGATELAHPEPGLLYRWHEVSVLRSRQPYFRAFSTSRLTIS